MPLDEVIVPADQIYERLGIQRPGALVVPGTKRHQLRKFRHVAEDGTESLWVNLSDVLSLMDAEFEATDNRTVYELAKAIRQATGQL
jgi:hypothetical protein